MKFLHLFKIPLPYLALLTAHIIWGINTVVVKVTLQEFPVMSLNFIRFSLACLLIAPFLLNLDKKKIRIKFEDLPRMLLASFLMATATIALGYEGIKYTTAINASSLTLIIPIISVLAGWWFLKEHIFWINLVGIGLGFLGCLVVIGLPLLFFGNFDSANIFGNILILISSLVFVAGAVVAKGVLKKYSALVVTAVAFLVGSVSFALPAGLEYIQNPNWVSQVTILGILGLLYITILALVSAYFLMEWGLKNTNLIKTNLFQYIEPAVTATVAVPLLGERISFSFIIGTVLIVLGVYWGTLGKPHHHILHHRHYHR